MSEPEEQTERSLAPELIPTVRVDPLELMCKIASIEEHGNRAILLSYSSEEDSIVSTIREFASAWFQDDRATELWHCTRALKEFFSSIEANKELLLKDVIIKTRRLYKSSGVRPIEGKNEYNKDVSRVDRSKYIRRR